MAKTNKAQGRVKGQPNRFIYGHACGWKHPNPRPNVPQEIQDARARERRRLRNLREYVPHPRARRSDEEARAARRALAARHLDSHRASEMARRARKRGAFVENVFPLVVLERDDGVCGICEGDVDPTDFHVDHVVPLARGGEHSYANVQAAHPICNVRKGWSRSPR